MFRLGCPRTGKMPRSVTPSTFAISFMTWSESCSSFAKSRPMILTELAPLTPDRPSSMLSWMYCEKLKPIPANSLENSDCKLVDELFLGHPGRPVLERLERHEKLGVVETGGVAAVVRPAVLRHHGDHFRDGEAESLRIWSTIGMPASSDIVGGIVARIHRLPSSSAGRNSVPSRGTEQTEDQPDIRRRSRP